MDERRQVLESYIKELLRKGKPLEEATNLVHANDKLLHESPYFSDDNIFGNLAKNSLRAATKFAIDIYGDEEEDEEYKLYRVFFDEHFKKARKDIISGRLLEFDGRQWQSVLLHLDATKSYAKAKGLKPHMVTIHLDRYMHKKRSELLIDIPKWDKVDRIGQLKDFVKIKNQSFEIFEEALKEWGANIFRRLYHDVYQNRCIILKGGQGIGKDHLLKSLLNGFGPYYSKFSSNRDERECWSQVTSKLVLHLEEFDQTGQLSVAFLKDLITRDNVTYRSPYDRDAMTKKCVGSFISTVNIDAVLRDETGNRRFAVFEIESIDWKYPKDWSAQVVAQFHDLYRTGYWAKAETWVAVTENNSHFEQVDMVPEYLNYWDQKVSMLSRIKYSNFKELTYAQVEGVIMDLCKQSGWRNRAVCSMLKVHGRSRKSHNGTLYWSNLINYATIDHGATTVRSPD